MTPTAIAAKLRQHSPGCLPESIAFDNGRFGIGGVDHTGTTPTLSELPDDVAEAVLIGAMVMDARLERGATGCHWLAYPGPDTHQMFSDPDHGGSLGACYAAWCWAKGLDTKETA